MKYTKKEVQGMFTRLVKAMNKSIDGGSHEGLHLDYASCYGGYVIEEHLKDAGCSHPFGCFRRNSREMYLSMWMATQVLEDIRYKQELLNKCEVI
jgi:hypothetical protein